MTNAVLAAAFGLLYLAANAPPQEVAPPILADSVWAAGAHGPVRVCIGSLAINVRNGEGVHAIGTVLRIINDDYLFAITPIPPMQYPVLRERQGPPLPLDGGLIAYPYDGPLPSIVSGPTLAAGSIRYVVFPDSRRSGGVVVGASVFNGTGSDQAVLSRLTHAATNDASCVQPLSFTSDQFGHRQEARRAGFESNESGEAIAFYPSKPFVGPGYHCQGGIGFRIEPGESLWRPWRPLGAGTSYLTHDGITIEISGPSNPIVRADPNDPDEHPMSLLHESRIIYYKSRGVGPPYAPPGVREDGSWRVELGREQNSRLKIKFPPSIFGYQLLERLEFVSKDDPRCKHD